MKTFAKNIIKSALTKKGNYPRQYVDILEITTDALRHEIHLAEQFYQSHKSDDPYKYIHLIKEFTDEVAKRQEDYESELYLPCHTGLYLLMRYKKPRYSLETGVERGGSTFALLKGLYENHYGDLYSYDISNSTRFMMEQQKEWQKNKDEKTEFKKERVFIPIAPLVPVWLRTNWHFVVGDSLKNVPKTLKELGKIQFFCAGHTHTYDVQKAETDNVWNSLEKEGILVIARSDFEDDKCFKELIKTQKIPPENYVECKESKHSLKFNYMIIIKSS